MASKEQQIAITKLRGCIRISQEYGRPLNTYHLDILFLIFLHEGITRKMIHEELNKEVIEQPAEKLSMTTTNRYVGDLTAWSYDRGRNSKLRRRGFDLVSEVDDENDQRVKRLYLNDKGLQLCETLASRVLTEQKNIKNKIA